MTGLIKTRQYAHQREVYERCRDSRYFALLWEPGLGKSKEVADVATYLYSRGLIDQLVVLAPKSVFTNWTRYEIPAHTAAPHVAMTYPANDADARHHVARMLWLDARRKLDRLRVLSMSFDSACTPHGQKFLMAATLVYRTMLVVDESTGIKSHTALRTKVAKRAGAQCLFRYILTGTPASESPFDLHSQFQFLDEDFWGHHGVRTFGAFKAEFGVFEKQWVGKKGARKQIDAVSGYRRLDELNAIIAPVSSRLLKEDSGVELPPKVYQRYSFEMLPEQERLYEQLRAEFAAELDGGGYVEAPLAITRVMRLQQITSGFVAAADSYEATFESDHLSAHRIVQADQNPRVRLLLEILELVRPRGKVIVWCKFTHEVDLVCECVPGALRFDGAVSDRAREAALDRFKDESDRAARVLVVNLKALSHGRTVTVAKTVVYFSNDYSLERRLQSEDRAHRIGQTSSVLIIDMVAEGTVDENVVDALREKYDVAAQVTGDRLREWIKPRS